MSVTTLSRLLPYALLALIGLAGWSMGSTALLAVVVVGTACVAIGTAAASRPTAASSSKVPEDASPRVKAIHEDAARD
jgi:hypothetical protein